MNLTTRFEILALTVASTTSSISLYASPASSANPEYETDFTYMPFFNISLYKVSPLNIFFAFVLLIILPLPCAVLANVSL